MTQEQEAVREFLSWLLTPVGSGTAIWLIAGFMFKQMAVPTTRAWKFWTVFGLCLLVPTLAYAASIYLFPPATFDLVTLLYYIGAAFTTSQLLNQGSQSVVRAVKRAARKGKGAADTELPPPVVGVTHGLNGITIVESYQPERDTEPLGELTPQEAGYPEGYKWTT